MNKPIMKVDRFAGLHSTLDQSHIGDNELQVAENVSWDREGILRNRQGVIVQGYCTGDFSNRAPKGYPIELEDNWMDSYFGGLIYPPNTITAGSDTVQARIIMICGIGGNDPQLSLYGDRITVASGFEQLTNGANITQIPGIVYNLGGTQWIYFADGIKIKWDTNFGDPTFAWVPPVNVRVGAFVLHKDRFFMADKWNLITNRLFFSAPGDPENWAAPDGGFFDIGNEDGGRITCAVSYQDAVYVFKTGSLWVLHTPGSPSNWTLRKVSELGCWGQTAVTHQGSIYFAGPDGVFRWNGNSATKLSGPIENLLQASSELRGAIAPSDGNWGVEPDVATSFAHGEKASPRACAFRDSYWLLTFNREGQTMLLEYNIKYNAWSRHNISGYASEDIMDIFAVPDDIQGVKVDSSTAQPGVYLSLRNTEQKQMRIVKMASNNWSDQHLKFISQTNINPDTTNIHTFLTLNESIVGWYLTSGTTLLTYTILAHNTGTNVILTLDQPLAGADVAQTIFYIWKPLPYISRIRTKLWNFGTSGSFKKIKGILLSALFRNLRVKVYVNDGVHLVSGQLNKADYHEYVYSTEAKDTYRELRIPGGFRAPALALEIETENNFDYLSGGDYYPQAPPGEFFGDFKVFGVEVLGVGGGEVGENTAHETTVRS